MKTNLSTDVVIIGAGIIGLATAYQLQQLFPHLKITILEKEKKSGMHQSSHNSGVVHSGVYYKPGSMKAQNCIEGRAALLEFCRENEVPLEKLGKVIVATEEKELAYLFELEKRGISNGVKGLKRIGKEQLKEIEPYAQSAIRSVFKMSLKNFSCILEKKAGRFCSRKKRCRSSPKEIRSPWKRKRLCLQLPI
jgi:L-2-hydroxyglutarate oxidase LhgO